MVSIPREFEASGYTPGSSVLVEDVGGGELRILPTDRVRQIADRLVSEHPEAMEILATPSAPETRGRLKACPQPCPELVNTGI